MTDDLVKRLQTFANGCRGSMWQSRDETIALMDEAADRIEALQAERDALAAEVERLRVALVLSRDEIDEYIWQEYPADHPVHERYRKRDFAANPARAALEGGKDG